MILEINPQFSHLKDFITSLPQRFDKEGTSIYQGRNKVKKFQIDKLSINVKQYCVPHLINQIAYTFFRKPKAYRAYHYAQEVIHRGFSTPTPIGYLICKSHGLISYSYFISIQIHCDGEIRDYHQSQAGEPETQSLLEHFAIFSANLHNADILHKDYSPGNILYLKENGKYHFSIVDINRMEFKKITCLEGAKNFARLFTHPQPLKIIAKKYAEVRGFNIEQCTATMLQEQQKFLQKNDRSPKHTNS